MAKWFCKSCGGTYQNPQPNGSVYFHACGPVPNPEYNTDPTAGPVDHRTHVERANKRDENTRPTTRCINGKFQTVEFDPHDATRQNIVQHDSRPLISEGDGAELVEEPASN